MSLKISNIAQPFGATLSFVGNIGVQIFWNIVILSLFWYAARAVFSLFEKYQNIFDKGQNAAAKMHHAAYLKMYHRVAPTLMFYESLYECDFCYDKSYRWLASMLFYIYDI